MVVNDSNVATGSRRRPARDLIAAVVENMRHNLEVLKYSTLAPSRYLVYLHPAEFARLEGIIPILQQETSRALSEELGRMNNRSGLRRYSERWFGAETPPVQTPSGDWQVEFLTDPDGELAEGDILIDSELQLPAQPELGVGERTRRLTTSHVGQQTTVRAVGTAERPPAISQAADGGQESETRRQGAGARLAAAPRALARLVYDDQSGRHTYDIAKDSITIGRGSVSTPVDVKIASSVDVSREHARIRRDPVTGQFFLTDLSSLGTTLNNRHVPRGVDETDGTRRETGVETQLPDQARIGLAEMVFLDFTRLP